MIHIGIGMEKLVELNITYNRLILGIFFKFLKILLTVNKSQGQFNMQMIVAWSPKSIDISVLVVDGQPYL